MNQSTTTTSNKIKYKIVLLGDQHVGKSSIIEKYINGRFDPHCSPTVGIDFLAKNVTHRNKNYRLQLWDTAGQERFRSLIPSYLKDAVCAIIVYDVSNKTSLQSAERWLRLFNDNRSGDGYTVLVGNKIDLPYRVVQTSEARQVAEQLKVGYWELSAKTGEKVEELFLHLVDMLSQGKINGSVVGSTPTTPITSEKRVQWQAPQEGSMPYAKVVDRLPMKQSIVHPVEQTQGVMIRQFRDPDTVIKTPQLYPQPPQPRLMQYPPPSSYATPQFTPGSYQVPSPMPLPQQYTTQQMIVSHSVVPAPNIQLNNPQPVQPETKPKRKCCSS